MLLIGSPAFDPRCRASKRKEKKQGKREREEEEEKQRRKESIRRFTLLFSLFSSVSTSSVYN